jgi:hypothetical protein
MPRGAVYFSHSRLPCHFRVKPYESRCPVTVLQHLVPVAEIFRLQQIEIECYQQTVLSLCLSRIRNRRHLLPHRDSTLFQ